MRAGVLLACLTLAAAGCLAPPQFAGGGLLGRPEIVSVQGGGLVVGERLFLARGTTWEPDAARPALEDFADMKRAGLNAVRFPAATPGLPDLLDAAASVDLRVILVLPGPADPAALSADEAAAIEREVRTTVALRGSHPAILLWEIGAGWDARASGDAGPWLAHLERLARIVTREDPWHPPSTTVTTIEAAARVRATAPSVAVIGMPAYPASHEAWITTVWNPWAEHVVDRPLLVVGFGAPQAPSGEAVDRAWREIEAQRRGGTRLAAGGLLPSFAQLGDPPVVRSLQALFRDREDGTPPAILAVEPVDDGDLLRVEARIVPYAGANLTVELLFRGSTDAWSATVMRPRGGDGWATAIERAADGLVFYRVRVVDEAGRDRTTADAVVRDAPLPGALAGLVALALAAGVRRRG